MSTTAAEAVPTTAAEAAPTGPVADLSEELTGGADPFIGAAAGADLEAAGYVEEEFVAAGEAVAYRRGGRARRGRTMELRRGHHRALPHPRARPPAGGCRGFSGTVVVEWLNVSGGVDANPDCASLEEEIIRRGDTWVGVSAQLIGVEGGPVLVSAPGAESVPGTGSSGSTRSATARSTTPVTATRSTSSPRSPEPCATTGRCSRPASRSRRSRSSPTTTACSRSGSVRRVLRAQPGRGGAPSRRPGRVRGPRGIDRRRTRPAA